MEQGRIRDAQDWGAGRIIPESGGEDVRFTERVLVGGTWSPALAGRNVRFERYVGYDEAKRVELI